MSVASLEAFEEKVTEGYRWENLHEGVFTTMGSLFIGTGIVLYSLELFNKIKISKIKGMVGVVFAVYGLGWIAFRKLLFGDMTEYETEFIEIRDELQVELLAQFIHEQGLTLPNLE